LFLDGMVERGRGLLEEMRKIIEEARGKGES